MRNCCDCSSPGNFRIQMLSPWRPFSQKTGVLFQGFSGSGANDEAASSAAESASPRKWQNTSNKFSNKRNCKTQARWNIYRKSGGIWPLLPFADQNSAALQNGHQQKKHQNWHHFLLSPSLCYHWPFATRAFYFMVLFCFNRCMALPLQRHCNFLHSTAQDWCLGVSIHFSLITQKSNWPWLSSNIQTTCVFQFPNAGTGLKVQMQSSRSSLPRHIKVRVQCLKPDTCDGIWSSVKEFCKRCTCSSNIA